MKNRHYSDIKNTKSVVIIPFGFPWDWVCDFEKQTALQLAKNHRVIAFFPSYGITIKSWLFSKNIQHIYPISRNIIGYKPIYIFPYPTVPFIFLLNQYIAFLEFNLWINRQYNASIPKILWMFPYQFFPSFRRYGNNYLKVYDCVDSLPKIDQKDEQSTINKLDIIFTNSTELYKQKKLVFSNTHLVPLGFDKNSFPNKRNEKFEPIFKKIPKPWVVYTGNINERLDYKFLENTIKQSPFASFLFIGPIISGKFEKLVTHSFGKILSYPNAYHINKIPRKHLGFVYKNALVGFIPYDSSLLFNKYSYPMKIMEYFYFGLPVISTDIYELRKFKPDISIVQSPQEAANKIRSYITKGISHKYKLRAHHIALENTWDKKIRKEISFLNSRFTFTNNEWTRKPLP